MTRILDRIDGPQDLHGALRGRAPAGRPGGPRAADRHGRRDRRALRRQPRRLRDRGRAALAARLAARQDPLGRRPPGLPAQDPHRPPRPARDDPQVRRPRAVLLDLRVRARHHGRRPRLDLDRLRRRPQGGDAPRRRRGRQGRRGDRRRRHDRRRRLRGDPPGRRPRHADRRRPQRQRHVDLAQRRRAVALLQPRPPRAQDVARARGRRGEADEAPGRHRRRLRAPRPAAQGVDQGASPRPACGGRSSTGPTWASSTATTSTRCATRCARAFEAERPVVVHVATVKGKGFAPAEEGGLEGMEKWHAAKPNSIAKRMPAPAAPKPQDAKRRAAAVHAGVRRGARARVPARRARRRHHRRDELRHRPLDPPEGDARPLLRRRHRRAAGRAVRRRPRAAGRAARAPRSTPPSCSAPTTRSSTTSACRACPSSSAWTAPGSSATTARPTTAPSTSPTCAACPTSR